LAIIKQLYGIERMASDRQFDAPARQRLRQDQARPLLELTPREWKRLRPDSSAEAAA
jgi:hypothetical protein